MKQKYVMEQLPIFPEIGTKANSENVQNYEKLTKSLKYSIFTIRSQQSTEAKLRVLEQGNM